MMQSYGWLQHSRNEVNWVDHRWLGHHWVELTELVISSLHPCESTSHYCETHVRQISSKCFTLKHDGTFRGFVNWSLLMLRLSQEQISWFPLLTATYLLSWCVISRWPHFYCAETECCWTISFKYTYIANARMPGFLLRHTVLYY